MFHCGPFSKKKKNPLGKMSFVSVRHSRPQKIVAPLHFFLGFFASGPEKWPGIPMRTRIWGRWDQKKSHFRPIFQKFLYQKQAANGNLTAKCAHFRVFPHQWWPKQLNTRCVGKRTTRRIRITIFFLKKMFQKKTSKKCFFFKKKVFFSIFS